MTQDGSPNFLKSLLEFLSYFQQSTDYDKWLLQFEIASYLLDLKTIRYRIFLFVIHRISDWNCSQNFRYSTPTASLDVWLIGCLVCQLEEYNDIVLYESFVCNKRTSKNEPMMEQNASVPLVWQSVGERKLRGEMTHPAKLIFSLVKCREMSGMSEKQIVVNGARYFIGSVIAFACCQRKKADSAVFPRSIVSRFFLLCFSINVPWRTHFSLVTISASLCFHSDVRSPSLIILSALLPHCLFAVNSTCGPCYFGALFTLKTPAFPP